MQQKFFAVMLQNNRTLRTKCMGIYDSEDIALEMWKQHVSHNRLSKLTYYVQECDIALKCRIIDSDLINRCYNIANCLELGERALLKGKFFVADDWFKLADFRSLQAAVILNGIL